MYSANSWSGHFNSTVRLALPVCLSNVGHIAVDLADNFFIGQLEEKTMGQAAITLAGIFYILVLVFAIGISYGLTPIVAEAHAQNRKDRIVLHLRHAFVQNIAIASLLFLVLFVCSPLLKHTGRPEEVTDLAIRFLNVMMLSMLPLSIFFTCKQFAEGMSDTKAAMVITIGANAMNIFLNWVLVFGHLGIEGMGVIGSCWATFISRCLMAAAMLGYILLNKKYHAFRPAFNFRKLLRAPVIEQLRIGIPSGLMFVMEVAAFGVPVLFIPGTDQLAAHRISIGLAAMTYMISSGLGAAATVRVGNHLGLRDRAGTRRAGFSAIFLALIFMAIAAVVFIVFRHNLTSVFNDDPGVLKYAIPLLLIAAAFQLFDGMQVTAQGALRGLKDTMIPGFIAFIAYWLIGLPASWYFCVQLDLGVEGVWYGFILGLAAAAAGFSVRFAQLTSGHHRMWR